MYQHNRWILLVDGNTDRAAKLATAMHHLDRRVEVARNGATGLLRAHETRPDLIVVAGRMPVLDGYRMVDALRSEPQTSDVPVILITEGSTHEELARGWSAGADFCIPWDSGEEDGIRTLHGLLARLEPRSGLAVQLAYAS